PLPCLIQDTLKRFFLQKQLWSNFYAHCIIYLQNHRRRPEKKLPLYLWDPHHIRPLPYQWSPPCTLKIFHQIACFLYQEPFSTIDLIPSKNKATGDPDRCIA